MQFRAVVIREEIKKNVGGDVKCSQPEKGQIRVSNTFFGRVRKDVGSKKQFRARRVETVAYNGWLLVMPVYRDGRTG